MKATVLSDGAWGTALALTLLANGHDTSLWAPFPEHVEDMKTAQENIHFLPGIPLPETLTLEADLRAAVEGAQLIVLAAPAQYLRKLLDALAAIPRRQDPIVVNVAKGIEVGSLLRMSELVESVLGRIRYAVLSGPSHAEEVAKGIPTAVTIASRDASIFEEAQRAFMNESLRVYTSYDVVGVELGGALKNVLALAAGVCDGMGFGDNTKAALMTRGIVEMARLGQALGGRAETFSGLSGVGDLIVTCMSRHSRNRYVGEQLGRGRSLPDIITEMDGKVAEGVTTAKGAHELAARMHVRAPIIDQIHDGLYRGVDPREAVRHLMTREAKLETH
ncbi:MAG: NAD(P)-dependent glycerol-3-phosphate dehydrogenase [Lentisphaeria bacterium]|nr:NAD(P)-dependent glycerol-3-phosphate dehydrogenase [Lentisphaeria bacterium]